MSAPQIEERRHADRDYQAIDGHNVGDAYGPVHSPRPGRDPLRRLLRCYFLQAGCGGRGLISVCHRAWPDRARGRAWAALSVHAAGRLRTVSAIAWPEAGTGAFSSASRYRKGTGKHSGKRRLDFRSCGEYFGAVTTGDKIGMASGCTALDARRRACSNFPCITEIAITDVRLFWPATGISARGFCDRAELVSRQQRTRRAWRLCTSCNLLAAIVPNFPAGLRRSRSVSARLNRWAAIVI